MPSRQRLGVLNAAHDLMKHLGHKLAPYLPEIGALVLTLLEGVSVGKTKVTDITSHILTGSSYAPICLI